jgi:hypothetical protein
MPFETIRNHRLICNDCGYVSFMPMLSEFHYGQFIGRSKNNNYVYVNSFEEDANSFFDSFAKYQNYKIKNDDQRREIVQTSVGELFLDTDDNNEKFTIINSLYCTSCNSKNVQFPEVPIDEPGAWYDVPHATHKRWSALSEKEQRSAIEKAINDYSG